MLLTRHPDNRYTARALAFPDVVGSGQTEQEALDTLRSSLAALQATSHVVQVDLPLPAEVPVHPWLRRAGVWAQDADWDAFEAAVETYRREIDEQFSAP